MLRATARALGKVLVVAEHSGTQVSPGTLSAVTAARALGDVSVLAAGSGHGAVVDQIKQVDGVAEVVSVDGAEYKNAVAETFAKLVNSVAAGGYTHVLAPHTSFGKGVIPYAAAMADAAPIPDVMDVISENQFRRPAYAANAINTVTSSDSVKYMTIRPASFEKAATEGGSASVVSADAQGDAGKAQWVEDKVDTSGKPDLTAARVVVSGGRGLKTGDNFDMLWNLAEKIDNCAVGATRAAVDTMGVASDMQVGQTGKVVAPDLYIAVGLSGAIQHLAGMKDSKVIAAINTDDEAAIFSVADYGLKADAFEAVPELQKLVESSS